jgi:acetyl-CoA C-acetyltransferase
VMGSREIAPPIRLYDCAPISEGAAAVVLAATDHARWTNQRTVHLLASAVATDRFRIEDRPRPLALEGARLSAQRAFAQVPFSLQDVSLFEVHDAFTIMTCLLLEAVGFAEEGEGWKLAAEGEIGRDGRVPLSTMGGLKARGHPIGATALYQVCEIVLQLMGRAGANQVANARMALMQSVGGAGVTVITHLFAVDGAV